MSFFGVLETVGKGFAEGLGWAVTYAVPVERLVALLFPSTAPAVTAVADATVLIQNAVLLVEQKYAAAGVQAGTGPQKLGEVMLLTESVVTQLLQQTGVPVTATYLEELISAIVAILNVQVVLPAKA